MAFLSAKNADFCNHILRDTCVTFRALGEIYKELVILVFGGYFLKIFFHVSFPIYVLQNSLTKDNENFSQDKPLTKNSDSRTPAETPSSALFHKRITPARTRSGLVPHL